jgi:hypothetical protein
MHLKLQKQSLGLAINYPSDEGKARSDQPKIPRRGTQVNGLRYPSDVTDEEWRHIVPLIPPAKHGGCKRKGDCREIVNEIMCVLSTGCQWR